MSIIVLGFLLAVIGVLFAIWYGIWLLWSWVLPQIWPTGPEAFIQPSFWLFVGAWALTSVVGRLLFKGGS